jgi:hypothetical protein
MPSGHAVPPAAVALAVATNPDVVAPARGLVVVTGMSEAVTTATGGTDDRGASDGTTVDVQATASA